MARFNVVMTAPDLHPAAVALLRAADCAIHYTAPYPHEAVVAELAARVRADAILARQGDIGAMAMGASDRLRIVARHGVGVEQVDLAAAAARGLLVTRTPGANARAVAEHTLAMILALVKRLPPLAATIAAGGWRDGAALPRDLDGLRLGLFGFGAIGRAVAGLAAPLGMRVAAHDLSPPRLMPPGLAWCAGLPDLAARSDVLSVHCPLTPATAGAVDAAVMAAMLPGGWVVNTARGGIVDEAALLAALDRGHLAGAALDVFATEPPPAGHPLRRHPAVIATPHLAGVTPAAFAAMGLSAAECIVAALTGGIVPPERIVRGA